MNTKSKHKNFRVWFPLVVSAAIAATVSVSAADDWSQFRGNGGTSYSDAELPTDLENSIIWKVPVPARGASGPIVVDGKVVVTCSGTEKQDQLYTVCFDADSGKRIWSQRLWATGRTYCHELSANAAPTPAADDGNVYVFYSSNDLACLSLEDGSLKWYRGLGLERPKAGNDVGMSSSPVVRDGVVVVQCEGPADAFVMGLDANDGTTLWTVERKKEAAWGSPLIISCEGGEPLVVLQSSEMLSIHDLKTGDEVYSRQGDVNIIPSPAFVDGVLFAAIDGVTALEVTTDGIDEIWSGSHVKTGSPSGVVYDHQLFMLNRAGAFTGYSLEDGSEQSSARVGGQFWATPVVAKDRAYFFTQNGEGKVVDLKTMEVISEHSFGDDEVFLGSPAISDSAMFIRSNNFLYKIAGKDAT